MALAGAYYQRGMPDSTLSVLDIWNRRIKPGDNNFARVAHLYGLASLAIGDTATAREHFEKIVQYGSEEHKQFVKSARRILETLDENQK